MLPARDRHYHRLTMACLAGRRLGSVASLLVAGAITLAACSSGPATGPTGSTGTTGRATGATGSTGSGPAHLSWIVTRQALAYMATNPLALAILEEGTIYEIVRPGRAPYPGVNAVVTADFKSYSGPAGLAASVSAGDLPAGTRAILYDAESWDQTPPAEQHDVGKYVQMATQLAHSHGYKLIATPGVDLISLLDPAKVASEGRYQAFLSSGILQGVSGADIVDIQAQSDERVASQYATFVKAAVAAVHKSNPSALVVSGLSSNPPIGAVTSQELADAMAATRSIVSGYWINIPNGHSASCPECGVPQPEVAIGALTVAFSNG